jgi:biopolymer transport protein ExbB/biopolymer transport protein TolQ
MGAMGNVMSGIAEALIATAVGILVALPAVIFYNVFQKKGVDVEDQAGALGNVILASMKSTMKKVETDSVPDAAAESVTKPVVRGTEAEA